VDNTLEQIQTKIAYLERANTDLSDVVFRLQQEIQALERKLKNISERVHAAQSADGERPPEDERPPHY
jgi:SlyX protein